MPSQRQRFTSLPVPALSEVLDRNEQVQQETDRVAAELTVLNTVLRQEIPAHAQAGDVAQALDKNDEIEERIQKSADELAAVNRVLEQEIDDRAHLEQELATTKRQLAQAERKSAAS
jgi:septal ring factor EnvC (AmiA/AmiB activator)